jgi:hypothetical protein
MTTTINYLKARFASPITAEEALPRLRSFIREGIEAHTFWKNHRCMERQGQRSEFWSQFQAKFPEVFAYLGPMVGGNSDQALLGFLEFGSEQSNELYVEGQFLFLKASGLWHGADWVLLAAFLKSRFGAESVAWIGDEPGIDFFDMLQP